MTDTQFIKTIPFWKKNFISAKIKGKISGLDDTSASSSLVITMVYKFSKNLGTTFSVMVR